MLTGWRIVNVGFADFVNRDLTEVAWLSLFSDPTRDFLLKKSPSRKVRIKHRLLVRFLLTHKLRPEHPNRVNTVTARNKLRAHEHINRMHRNLRKVEVGQRPFNVWVLGDFLAESEAIFLSLRIRKRKGKL